MSRAREIARQVVTRVRERDAYAHETLDAALKSARLDARESAFATRLAYGTIACRGTLDEALNRFLSAPARVEPIVRDALCVSAYELLFASTPARAAVSEGVELVRSSQPRAAGLANAVLRKLAAEADRFPWGDTARDNAALARAYGHPRWLAELWIAELGREAAASIMAADNEPAPLFLAQVVPHADTLAEELARLEADGAEPASCPLQGCIVASKPAAAIRSAAVTERRLIVIDGGAQLAATAVPLASGNLVVELGAGRGSKSLMLAGRLSALGGGKVVAVDSHGFKLEALDAAASTMGLAPMIESVTADATDPVAIEQLPAPGTVDAVLVDAPCSGLGTLRRHPDRRWRATYDDVETLALLGSQLLATAARLVKPGGFVVYSTCTIARRENREVVDEFLGSEAGEGFTVDALDSDVPAGWERFVDERGMFQSLPEVGGIDGHFVARLRRG